MLNGTKILVLGGSGFLGTHLVEALLQQGATVRVFHQNSNKIETKNSRLEIYTGDFVTGNGLESALSKVDIIYHLIHTTIPSTSNANPIIDVQQNLVSSIYLLQKMQDMKIKRIVYISSGGTVYGNPSVLPVPETHSLHPLCSYGIVKVAIENYLHMASELYGLNAIILRLSNPYGPLQIQIGIQGIISTLFKKIMMGEKIQIWNDGSVIRDYIYVSDVIDAMVRAAFLSKSGVYNIGSGIGHSLKQVIEIVCKLLEKSAEVEYLPPRLYDVDKIFLDITKATTELGWKPTISLQQGCERYWQLIRSRLVDGFSLRDTASMTSQKMKEYV